MIYFFRRICQKLLAENRLSRYMVYAIGEIALVMIGILLALQVNNWNEKKKQIATERSILMEMKENLKSDLGDISGNITFDSTNQVATLRVLTHLENKEPFNDELRVSYGNLGWASLFAENTSAFESLKSLGFNIITNDELRGKITYLYSTRYEYLNEILTKFNDLLFDNFRPYLVVRTSSQTGDFFNREPNNYFKLSEDLQFQEMLREDLFTKEFSIRLNRKVKKEVNDLITLIDKELM